MPQSSQHAATVLRPAGCVLVAASLLLGPHEVHAGIVTDDPPPNPVASGPGLGTMSYNDTTTVSPGNDNVPGPSDNFLQVAQKAFDFVDFIDMVFDVTDLGTGTTEYELQEGVFNGTGVPWTDYHVVLGFGTGASFVPSGPGDGLDFDAPDFDSPYDFGPFTSLTIAEDTIDADGGVFPDFTFINFRFPLDVPDGISEFTIRQLPTISAVVVPEPSGLVLTLVGLFGLGLFGRHRKSRS